MKARAGTGSLVAACVLGVALAASAAAGARVELNGEWRFRIDPIGEGEKAGWSAVIPDGTESVSVPHTWGIGRYEDHEGRAWYFRRFSLAPELVGKHVEIHFGATFYRARVWLNGASLGEHEGGYTAYALDATGVAKAENLLVVEIDNRPGRDTIPGWALRLAGGQNIWYDWWHYGGIVRAVWLTAHDGALLRRQRIRTRVEGTAALVDERIAVENHTGAPLDAEVLATAFAPDGSVAAKGARSLSLAPGLQEVGFSLRIDPVRLWHFDDPQLYRMEARLVDGEGRLLDVLSDGFGARRVEIRERKLYLNGEHVRLTGITRHEESPWEGLAESAGTIRRDFDDMKALHVTLTRPVHYPQHPLILDYCDRTGILIVPEIPMWQFSEAQMADPRVIALARQMMREMVEEAGNHPSIIGWSVCNESDTTKPGGVAYVRAMRDFLKSLDPQRLVTYADDSVAHVDDPRATAAVLADFVMMNQYFGSWHGPAEQLHERLTRLGRLLPEKMLVISEFGLAGVFAADEETADARRRALMREQMAEFARHDFIGGAIFWCYQDYKSHRNLPPGETTGFVEMGLVDEWRQRRGSYALWQELNAPARASVAWNETYATPTAFRATITPRNEEEMPFYRMRGYRLEWQVWDDDDAVVATGAEVVPEIDAPLELEKTWSRRQSKSLRLRLRLVRPTGFAALDQTFTWWEPRSGGLTVDEMRGRGQSVP